MELFVIQRHGRPAGITAVRFTQTCGAASGLRGLHKLLYEHLKFRGQLFEDQVAYNTIVKLVTSGDVLELGIE
jgi:hypothetical protein